MAPTKTELAPVVAVINMKGGVGKTTITANVFRHLFKRHRLKTLLIDFDPQFNLTQLLMDREKYEELKAENKTLWNVMNPQIPFSVFQVSETDLADPGEVDSYVSQQKYVGREPRIPLNLLAGDVRFATLNIVESSSSLRVPRKRFDTFLKRAREQYEIIVMDCNPSSSHMTRIALENATHLLVPVRPDKYSILGLETLADYVHDLPSLATQPAILVLVNGVAEPGVVPGVVRQLRTHDYFGPLTLNTEITTTKLLAADPEYTGFATDKLVPYRHVVGDMLNRVADELAERLGVANE